MSYVATKDTPLKPWVKRISFGTISLAKYPYGCFKKIVQSYFIEQFFHCPDIWSREKWFLNQLSNSLFEFV